MPSTCESRRIWLDKPDAFNCRKVCRFRHSLSEHPLLALPRLQQLAESLQSRGQCKFTAPDAKPHSPFNLATRSHDNRDIAEVFEAIAAAVSGTWIAIYNIECETEYRDFLHEALAAVRPVVDRQDPGLFGIGGYLFLSTPPAVTPFHIDRDNNFWLQMHGSKQICVWDPDDRESVSEAAIERFIAQDDLSEVRLDERCRTRCVIADVGPGDGIYIPSTAPHTTQARYSPTASADNGYALSMALVYYTRATRHRAYLYALNHSLRMHGIRPTPPERSAWRDAVKYPLARAVVAGRKWLRGYHPPVGM